MRRRARPFKLRHLALRHQLIQAVKKRPGRGRDEGIESQPVLPAHPGLGPGRVEVGVTRAPLRKWLSSGGPGGGPELADQVFIGRQVPLCQGGNTAVVEQPEVQDPSPQPMLRRRAAKGGSPSAEPSGKPRDAIVRRIRPEKTQKVPAKEPLRIRV